MRESTREEEISTSTDIFQRRALLSIFKNCTAFAPTVMFATVEVKSTNNKMSKQQGVKRFVGYCTVYQHDQSEKVTSAHLQALLISALK